MEWLPLPRLRAAARSPALRLRPLRPRRGDGGEDARRAWASEEAASGEATSRGRRRRQGMYNGPLRAVCKPHTLQKEPSHAEAVVSRGDDGGLVLPGEQTRRGRVVPGRRLEATRRRSGCGARKEPKMRAKSILRRTARRRAGGSGRLVVRRSSGAPGGASQQEGGAPGGSDHLVARRSIRRSWPARRRLAGRIRPTERYMPYPSSTDAFSASPTPWHRSSWRLNLRPSASDA